MSDGLPTKETVTTSGRTSAPDTPSDRVPIKNLTVAELGSCLLERGWVVNCPGSRSSCAYQYNESELRAYDVAMLAIYFECEVCGVSLEVVPPEEDE